MGSSSAPSVLVYVPGFVKIYVERLTGTEIVPALPAPPESGGVGVQFKDVMLNSDNGVYVRIYVPQPVSAPLPVLVYIHGGAFCTETAASPTYHNYVLKLAEELKMICVSVNYRLAPEHRLPAAYDDCWEALRWLRSQAEQSVEGSSDPWLNSHMADFTNCFLAGDSAGPNVIHELGIRAGCDSRTSWGEGCPLTIRGVVLVHPFFWGKERFEYEPQPDGGHTFANFVRDTNNLWKLCLPEGEDFDYGPCNPVGPRGYHLIPTLIYPHFLVVIAGKDPRRHRALLYRNAVYNISGKTVQTLEQKDVGHDYHLKVNTNSSEDEKSKAREMVKTISEFIRKRSVRPLHSTSPSPSTDDDDENAMPRK